MLEEHDGRAELLVPQFVNQGALFAQAVLVVALGNNHDVAVVAQQGNDFFIEVEVGEEKEFYLGTARGTSMSTCLVNTGYTSGSSRQALASTM